MAPATLPLEIFLHICDEVRQLPEAYAATLAAVARTSRALHPLATRVLYHTVVIDSYSAFLSFSDICMAIQDDSAAPTSLVMNLLFAPRIREEWQTQEIQDKHMQEFIAILRFIITSCRRAQTVSLPLESLSALEVAPLSVARACVTVEDRLCEFFPAQDDRSYNQPVGLHLTHLHLLDLGYVAHQHAASPFNIQSSDVPRLTVLSGVGHFFQGMDDVTAFLAPWLKFQTLRKVLVLQAVWDELPAKGAERFVIKLRELRDPRVFFGVIQSHNMWDVDCYWLQDVLGQKALEDYCRPVWTEEN